MKRNGHYLYLQTASHNMRFQQIERRRAIQPTPILNEKRDENMSGIHGIKVINFPSEEIGNPGI